MFDLLYRILFTLLAGATGFISGGMVVMLVLRNRPRTGFEGVAEAVLGAGGGIIVGLVIGIVLSGRLDHTQRLWGLLVLAILIAVQVGIVMALR